MDRRAFLRRATAVAGVAAIAPVAAFLPAPATYKALVIGKERLEQVDAPYSGFDWAESDSKAYDTAVAQYQERVTEFARQHELYMRRLAADRAFFA